MLSLERITSRLSPTSSRAAPNLLEHYISAGSLNWESVLLPYPPSPGQASQSVNRLFHGPTNPSLRQHRWGKTHPLRTPPDTQSRTHSPPGTHPLITHPSPGAHPPHSKHPAGLAHPMSSTSTRLTHTCTSVQAAVLYPRGTQLRGLNSAPGPQKTKSSRVCCIKTDPPQCHHLWHCWKRSCPNPVKLNLP